LRFSQKFGMAQNDGQKIIKIVGDTACELADRLHPADLLRDAGLQERIFSPSRFKAFHSTLAFRLLLSSFWLPAERRPPDNENSGKSPIKVL